MVYDDKRTLILEAAARRFLHFGLAKTTMMDIANDLAMSKALLYYYYPDKSSLYTAVFEKEIQRTYQETEESLKSYTDVQDALMFLLNMRMEFVKRNYNLFDYTMTALQHKPKEMTELFHKGRLVQQDLIIMVMEKGVRDGQIQNVPLETIAEMIQFALEGMRWVVLKEVDRMPFPTQEEFERILNMQKALCVVLINGLRQENKPLGAIWQEEN